LEKQIPSQVIKKMNWNLVWINELNETNKSSFSGRFVFYLRDEPILTKRMYGQVCRSEKDVWMTFVENSHKFSFEDFNEFVTDFSESAQAKFQFDVWDGEEAFAYDSDSERLVVALESYTSNMNFSIPIDERTRTQFTGEFTKFLNCCIEFFESATKQDSNTLDDSSV